MNCPICLKKFSQNEPTNESNITITPCNHKFHTDCLLIHTSINDYKCPCCRNELIKSNLVRQNTQQQNNQLNEDFSSDDIYPSCEYVIQSLKNNNNITIESLIKSVLILEYSSSNNNYTPPYFNSCVHKYSEIIKEIEGVLYNFRENINTFN
jgi:hypothetical protein